MVMQIINQKDYRIGTASQVEDYQKIDQIVLDVIQKVRQKGNQALIALTERFDKVSLNQIEVTDEEIEFAYQAVEDAFIIALKKAKDNITEFHHAQKEKSWFYRRDDGTILGQQVTAMARVGVYVPGGKAAYPSTVLMDILPAKIAGVEEIAMTTPPQADGKINPHVLVAAHMAGVNHIYKVGGAQAIAALAYGTESIPRVDKIVGPGNIFVARAKKWVYGDVGIDMIAGPSEICVMADESANVSYIAADLLSQAEHDENARAIAIVFSQAMAEKVKDEVNKQLKNMTRKEIASASIQNNGKIILVDTMAEAIEMANQIAPEHLELMVENATEIAPQIKHAGAIFIGSYSPEPLGDYMAGPNHTLPTSGTARFASPLGVYDFMKKSSLIHYSKKAFLQEAEAIEILAAKEGLHGHATAIRLRRQELSESKEDKS